MNNVGIKILNARKKFGISQIKLAEMLNKTRQTVAAYESGKYLPSITTLNKIAKVLSVPVEYFMNDRNFYQDTNMEKQNVFNVDSETELRKQLLNKTEENKMLKRQIEVLKDTVKLLELKLKITK